MINESAIAKVMRTVERLWNELFFDSHGEIECLLNLNDLRDMLDDSVVGPSAGIYLLENYPQNINLHLVMTKCLPPLDSLAAEILNRQKGAVQYEAAKGLVEKTSLMQSFSELRLCGDKKKIFTLWNSFLESNPTKNILRRAVKELFFIKEYAALVLLQRDDLDDADLDCIVKNCKAPIKITAQKKLYSFLSQSQTQVKIKKYQTMDFTQETKKVDALGNTATLDRSKYLPEDYKNDILRKIQARTMVLQKIPLSKAVRFT